LLIEIGDTAVDYVSRVFFGALFNKRSNTVRVFWRGHAASHATTETGARPADS